MLRVQHLRAAFAIVSLSKTSFQVKIISFHFVAFSLGRGIAIGIGIGIVVQLF